MLDISSDLVVFKALADSNRLRILDYLKKENLVLVIYLIILEFPRQPCHII